ncbi:MAG: UvrD-helicase domain-containing protein [Gemmatimonadota bacterium]
MAAKPSAPGEILLPREVVLASAGTGKTFTLSSRLISLLARGAPPDSLLASTFTRKAAGEILTRVLSRLARASLDEDQARALARETLLPGLSLGEDPGAFQSFPALLRSLVRELHRANVGTLDSFFLRIAGSFPGELGMPPDWAISDEPTSLRLESEALQELLSGADPLEMVELVRMTMRGESGRGVHQRLLVQLRELRALLHQQGLSDPEAVWHPPGAGIYEGKGGARADGAWEYILRELQNAPLPKTARGAPDTRFENAISEGIDALKKGDWTGFCGKGLASKILAGEESYYRKPVPPELRKAFERALAGVTKALREELAAQTRALRTLVLGFDGALDKIHRREGAYRFEDITYLLAGADPLTTRTDLWYRLDQKAHHLLLDEFQDTSRAQWEALEPLVSELLAGHPEERSALVVADPKQSIYGWRGAEPSLARRVGARFGMEERSLDRSYRSSAPVLEIVNQVFGKLPENPVWQAEADLIGGVRDWSEGFPMHRPALEIPGYVSLEVGPRDARMGKSDRPALMAWAAGRIRELQSQSPEATLGVLVRRNATVSQLMAHLRSLGVEASEEGATTLTDSPAVSTFLALLRLADHPGDRVARYQVAWSPLGAMVGLTPHDDPSQARRAALGLRRELLTHGYGTVLTRWTHQLRVEDAVDGRELARLLQLVELAFRWDARSNLRPRDFVRFVQHEAVEAPSEARVRVMTVHKAKGLEFDVVVLPELDIRLTRGRGLYHAVLPLRDPEDGKILRIFPSLNQILRPLFPEVEEAGRQDRDRELHDALGVAYVALTRARHALHLFTAADPPDEKPKLSFSFAGLLRGALGLDETLAEEGATLYEIGNGEWASGVSRLQGPGAGEDEPRSEGLQPSIRPPRRAARRRFLPHRSPSALKDAGRESLARILSLSGSHGRRVGTIIHAWLETLSWIEGWIHDPAALHALGTRVVPNLSPVDSKALQDTLMGWLGSGEVRSRLQQDAYPPGSEVLTELPFAVKLEDALFQGRVDRVVLVREGTKLVTAEVLDFKTDQLLPGDEENLRRAVKDYEGQMGVYRHAVATLFGLPVESVTGTLVFLALGRLEPSPG